jgi:quinoprotein glucose dehydrogenase
MRQTRRAIAGLVVVACVTLGAQQSRSSWSGVYTAEQAAAGERIYFQQCASCHGADLAGIERAPALTGGSFLDAWHGRDLRQLLERIETMPPTAPKSLSPADSVAVLAYLLREAEMPGGTTALPTDRGQLVRITFERTRAATEERREGVPGDRVASAPAPTPTPPPVAAAQPAAPAKGATLGTWTSYGSNLASHRYSPADQITKDNFSKLQIAWRLKTDFLGPRPDTLYSATPLQIDRVLYTTAGMRRAVIALDAVTGEMRWMHSEDEGRRGQNAIRSGAGRGVAYWASADGSDRRIIYVTPGYRLKALDARTGIPIPGFGRNGAVDLKTEIDQDGLDLDTAELGLNATPLVVGDVIVVGAAHRPGSAPRTMRNQKGYVRGYDARTGKRLWIFHTIPRPGQFGYDTWLEGSAEYNGNTGVWAQMSADADLGLVYVPVEMPTGDYYGGNRPGNNLFADSLVALDVKTGKRKWHYQVVHHDVWDWDLACAPILFDTTVNGRPVKAVAQPTKQAFLFVFNRETGEPIWPIEERPVPQSDVPKERTSPTQPFPTRPAPFDRQGITENDLLDLTPALKTEAIEVAKRYKMGPIFTPPVVSSLEGPLATLQLPSEVGGANWPGGSFDPETNALYIHSHANVFMNALVPANPAQSDMGYIAGQARAGGAGARAGGPADNTGARGAAPAGNAAARGAGPAAGRGGGGGGRAGTVQGLPLIKPPYDQVTAYNMNTGDIIWQKTHSSTPDDIKNHPALKGVTLPDRVGQPGRTFIGTLTTKNLLQRHPWLEPDTDTVTVLRSVLMKPEHLPVAGALADAMRSALER